MPYVRSRYYREEEKPAGYRRVEAGFGLLEKKYTVPSTGWVHHCKALPSECKRKSGLCYERWRYLRQHAGEPVAGTMVLCDGTQPSAPGVRPL